MPKTLGNTTYYDPSEVATVINRDYETALRRIRNGDLPAEKVNGGYLVARNDLIAYLDEYEALPASIIDLRLGHRSPRSDRNITASS